MIFLDASAVIYLIEGDPALQHSARQVLARLIARQTDPALVISAPSLLECRVDPIRRGSKDRLEKFDLFFSDPGLVIVELNQSIINKATQLRAHHGLRTPDALQAASCLAIDPETPFVTGDKDFKNLKALNTYLINK